MRTLISSHREAPEISKDPVADSADVHAFVSPDKPETVTLIANCLPLRGPAGGPNFYEFGDDVLYEIHIDNNGDGRPEISYQFRFTATVTNENTFLCNAGPIESLESPNWNRRQSYSVTRLDAKGRCTELGHETGHESDVPCRARSRRGVRLDPAPAPHTHWRRPGSAALLLCLLCPTLRRTPNDVHA